ncbi:polysaccharide pyruvyl transferase family protein [Ectopseudomonas mendocina]|uniref:polysaccharide pyruvyl transferase family protein n=1 Tax=Ectopseudomonas mendocina TaxID=300 RepID=UPI00376EB42D
MKKISPLVSAWVGQGNYGDELLSYGLRLELDKACGVVGVTYYHKGAYDIFCAPDEPVIEWVNSDCDSRLRRLYRGTFQSYKKYDGLFYGGGSVLHSSNSISWKHDLLSRFRRENSSLLKPAIGVGLSIGPFPSKDAELKAEKFLRELDFVYCRDELSADFCKSLNGKIDVIEGRDLAFSVRALRPDLFDVHKTSGRVGVSFILDSKLDDQTRKEHFNKMLALIDFLTGLGRQVLLVSLYSGMKYADNLLHSRLREAAQDKDLIVLEDYQGDVFKTTKAIASCESYISMRLHGVIAAYLSSTPFFALNDHPKVSEFCRSILNGGGSICQGTLSMPSTEILEHVSHWIATVSTSIYRVDEDAKYLTASDVFAMRMRQLL